MSAGWYVYAIVARTVQLPPGLRGLGDGTLSTVAWRDLAAVTSPLAGGVPRRIAEHVLRHGAVVEGLQRCGPTLPVRFGTTVADSDGVARALAERHAELAADLARLGDKVEFGLTVLRDGPPGGDETRPGEDHLPRPADGGDEQGPGTRYLRARLAEARRDAARREQAGMIAREVDARLGSEALERRCSIAPTDRLVLRASFLIEPTRFGGCRQAIDAVRRRHPDLRFLVSGPWPPYSFVSRDEPDGRASLGRSLLDLTRWLTPLRSGG